MTRLLGLTLLTAVSIAVAAAAGPFGFEPGMTREQVIRLVGQDNVVQEDSHGDVLILRTAPIPHPAFERYLVIISPKNGLLKIQAIGVDISTNRFGRDIRSKFAEIRNALIGIYGSPEDFDFLLDGSIWTDPQHWTMGLLKNERTLAADWHANGMFFWLRARAVSLEKGYLALGCEFAGFDQYTDSKKADQNKAFGSGVPAAPKTYAPRLTNNDVFKLIQAGVSDDQIIAKIQTSETDFDLSPGRVTALRGAGFSEPVIRAMVTRRITQ
jgi:hypothetical protein